jgi:hypothetical protein
LNIRKVLIFIGILLLLGLALSYSPTIDNQADNNRHTLTWISNVTPESASWAKNLSFTDVVVIDDSEESHLNLANENITYWHCVSAFSLTNTSSVEVMKQELADFVKQSPNSHVYLDDTNYLLEEYGVSAANNLFNAIREIQATNTCKFILDGYMSSLAANLYPQVDMTGIDFDAYQPPTLPYDLSKLTNPKTIGIYVWAYGCAPGGVSWSTMTDEYLDSVYKQAKDNNLTRLIIWDGYKDISELLQDYAFPCMYEACLYYFPEWWEKVKAENLKFLGNNP